MAWSRSIPPKAPPGVLVWVPLFVAGFLGGCCAGHGWRGADRAECYVRAEVEASRRAFLECPGVWEACPARPDILSELERAYRGCV